MEKALVKRGKISATKKETFSKRNRKQKIIRLSKIKYEEKIVQIKRVTKVVKGGKKMTFRAIVIIGDNKRKVGVGIGRADDVNLAIDKAVLNGKKSLVTVPLTYQDSVPHVVKSSYGACSIMLRPAAQGSGIIAGGSVKTVLELAGIKNILAKQFGAKNILNNAKATILALTLLNEKVELGKDQSIRKQYFYEKIMRKYKNVRVSN
jgi:small subunit ribosomal protein S5